MRRGSGFPAAANGRCTPPSASPMRAPRNSPERKPFPAPYNRFANPLQWGLSWRTGAYSDLGSPLRGSQGRFAPQHAGPVNHSPSQPGTKKQPSMFFIQHRGLLFTLIIQHLRLDLSFCRIDSFPYWLSGVTFSLDSLLFCSFIIKRNSYFCKTECSTEIKR